MSGDVAYSRVNDEPLLEEAQVRMAVKKQASASRMLKMTVGTLGVVGCAALIVLVVFATTGSDGDNNDSGSSSSAKNASPVVFEDNQEADVQFFSGDIFADGDEEVIILDGEYGDIDIPGLELPEIETPEFDIVFPDTQFDTTSVRTSSSEDKEPEKLSRMGVLKRVVERNEKGYREIARNYLGGACNAATGKDCNPTQLPADGWSAPYATPSRLVTFDPKQVTILPGSGYTGTASATIYQSTSSWSNRVSGSFGLSGSGTYKGATFSGSLAMSDVAESMFGGKSRHYFAESRSDYSVFFADFRPKAVEEAALAAINALPAFDKSNEGVRNQYFDFFSQFGTHYVRSVEFGGLFRQTATIDVVGADERNFDESIMSLGLGASFKKAASGNFSMGSSLTTEQQKEFESIATFNNLRVVGGEQTNHVMPQWLETVEGAPLPIGTTLEHIAEMFSGKIRTDLYAAYSAYLSVCPADEHNVVCGGSGSCNYEASPATCSCPVTCKSPSVMGPTCSCQCPEHIKCMNGGKLIPETCECVCPGDTCKNCGFLEKKDCSCRCRGNDKHGWQGPRCEETYGRCHPGPGSGNPDGSCNGNNDCKNGGGGASTSCRDTEVCCNTCCKSQCAPYGSTCSCGAFSCSINPGPVCDPTKFDPNCACPN